VALVSLVLPMKIMTLHRRLVGSAGPPLWPFSMASPRPPCNATSIIGETDVSHKGTVMSVTKEVTEESKLLTLWHNTPPCPLSLPTPPSPLCTVTFEFLFFLYLRIEAQMLVASEEATAGSVIANAERMSPRSKGTSHSRCWALVAVPQKHLKSNPAQAQKVGTQAIDALAAHAEGRHMHLKQPLEGTRGMKITVPCRRQWKGEGRCYSLLLPPKRGKSREQHCPGTWTVPPCSPCQARCS